MPREKSLKKNYLLNLANTILGAVFPIFTFPYVSRILEPAGIGVINFNQAIVTYIMTISTLGIAGYGVREISRLKDDKYAKTHTLVEILALHLLLTLVGYIAVMLIYVFVPEVHKNGAVFLILSIPIFFNAIGVIWFLQAHEEFQFLMMRSLIVKVLSAVALFTLVKNRDDVIVYAAILSVAESGNNFLNFIKMNSMISFKTVEWNRLNVFRHLKPTSVVFVMSAIFILYLNMQSVFLGFVGDDENVGYYNAAIKLVSVIVLVVSALTTTMLPRVSHYISSGQRERFKEVEQASFSFTIALTLPIMTGILMLSHDIIYVFAGARYAASVPVIRILAPTVLFVGIATIAGLQVLYPQGQEKRIIKSASIGLLVCVMGNIFLTPRLLEVGASCVISVTELVITLLMLTIGRRFISYNFFNRSVLKYLCASIVMAGILWFLPEISENVYLRLATHVLIGLIVYVAVLLVSREKLLLSLLRARL